MTPYIVVAAVSLLVGLLGGRFLGYRSGWMDATLRADKILTSRERVRALVDEREGQT